MTYQMRANKAPLLFELAINSSLLTRTRSLLAKIEHDLVVLQNPGKQIIAPCNWSRNYIRVYYFLVSNK
jgi:hypothetical protein